MFKSQKKSRFFSKKNCIIKIKKWLILTTSKNTKAENGVPISAFNCIKMNSCICKNDNSKKSYLQFFPCLIASALSKAFFALSAILRFAYTCPNNSHNCISFCFV